MKILYLGEKHKLAPDHMYLYYGDLYRSLCKIADVQVAEHPPKTLPVDIELVIFGISHEGYSSESVRYNVPTIYILHKPQIDLQRKMDFCRKSKIDLLVYSQSDYGEYGKMMDIPSVQLWMAGDKNLYAYKGESILYDFGFSGALHGGDKIKGDAHDLRNRIYKKVAKIGLKLFWNGSDSVGPRIKSPQEYAQKINQSKIWLATTGPLNDVGVRYFEVCLSGALLCCNRMGKEYGNLFVDGENCIMFGNDLNDIEDKLIYYAKNDRERSKIVKEANRQFSAYHTWDYRAQELIAFARRVSCQKSTVV